MVTTNENCGNKSQWFRHQIAVKSLQRQLGNISLHKATSLGKGITERVLCDIELLNKELMLNLRSYVQ